MMKHSLLTLAIFALGMSANAQLIWNGDASQGITIFKVYGTGNVESPSTLTAVDDPERGRIWRYHKPSGSNRCENHGIRVNGSGYTFQNGQTYYLGWSTKLTNTADNNAIFQWKSYDNHIQNFPVVLKLIGGRLSMLQRQPGPVETIIWSAPFSANNWHHIALGLFLSDETRGGWVELYFNGVQQTFNNGTQRYACRTFDSHNCPKWGIYGRSDLTITNYVDDLKVGRTYNDVKMAGGGTLPSIGTGTTQAESLNRSNFVQESNYNGAASVVKPASTSAGYINGRFTGSSGTYNVSVRYYDENDGAVTITLRTNGTSRGSRTFSANDEAWKTWTVNNISISNGHEIKIEGAQNSGEHGRIDYIQVSAASAAMAREQGEVISGSGETTHTNESDLIAYPNPVSGKVTVEYKVEKAGPVTISLYAADNNKTIVLLNESKTEGMHQYTFETENLPKGLHFIKVITSGSSSTQKLIKK